MLERLGLPATRLECPQEPWPITDDYPTLFLDKPNRTGLIRPDLSLVQWRQRLHCMDATPTHPVLEGDLHLGQAEVMEAASQRWPQQIQQATRVATSSGAECCSVATFSFAALCGVTFHKGFRLWFYQAHRKKGLALWPSPKVTGSHQTGCCLFRGVIHLADTGSAIVLPSGDDSGTDEARFTRPC